MLIKIAETFEVSISKLLGVPFDNKQDVNAIANQLSRINEQLAIKNRHSRWIWKIIIGLFLAFIIFHIFLSIVASVSLNSYQNKTTTHIEKIAE